MNKFGSNMGTPIVDLHKNNKDNGKNNNNNIGNTNFRNIPKNYSNSNPNIEKLVSNINNSLDNDSINNYLDSETDRKHIENVENIDDIEGGTTQNDKWLARIPNFVKDIVLFLFIYYIFSLDFVKQSIGNYIKYINPDASGSISSFGILIYGFILIIVFMVSKFILFGYY